ncbi:MAG: Jag N-terminal domain-containing protein [Rhodanobacter sp.]
MVNSSGASSQEFTGKTVEEATADGLRALGLRADDATIEVLSRGSRGLFGIGSEPAIVRISRRVASASVSSPASTPVPPAGPDPAHRKPRRSLRAGQWRRPARFRSA